MKAPENHVGASEKGWEFQRHLSEPFVYALEKAFHDEGWWREVILDAKVIVALRNDYLNVYFRGQSLFKVWCADKTGELLASTHPKYLLDPQLGGQITLKAGAGGKRNYDLGSLREPLLTSWHDGALERLKKAARYYSGLEKTGCHKAAAGRDDILDAEVTFRREAAAASEDEEAKKLPRIDLLRVVRAGDDCAALEFWEAKHFQNPELGSKGHRVKNGDSGDYDVEREVIAQIRDYRDILERNADAIVASYSKACEQLVRIHAGTGRYGADSIIGEVASGKRRLLIGPGGRPMVNLLVFGFDEAQKVASAGAFADLDRKVRAAGGGKLRKVGDAAQAFARSGKPS